MRIIGRKREKDVLSNCLSSGRPEFVFIYGRRRVGKTYLIKEFFKGQFTFYATGLSYEKTAGQLKAFQASLRIYGSTEKTVPKDWFEAFTRLRELISSDQVYRDPTSGRRVVFLDELPWMDTVRSDLSRPPGLEFLWKEGADYAKKENHGRA